MLPMVQEVSRVRPDPSREGRRVCVVWKAREQCSHVLCEVLVLEGTPPWDHRRCTSRRHGEEQ